MSTRTVITAKEAPAALGPYSHAVSVNKVVFLSGQLGIDPKTGMLASGGVQAETEQALRNLQAVLESAGLSLENVVKTTVFLADINDFGAMNEIYAQFFSRDAPARSAFQVAALPKRALVEIEAIAAADDGVAI